MRGLFHIANQEIKYFKRRSHTLLSFIKISAMASVSAVTGTLRRLEGKVALITGGASGIGEATARLFWKHGSKVVIADIQQNLAQSICNDLQSSNASFVHCDVTKEKDVENAVNTTISKHGKLDIMFNNAGIAGVNKTNIVDNTLSEFEEVIKVNLVGVFLGTKHAARVMKPTRSGSIINTSSVCGSIGGGSSHAYTCSKHGVIGLMRNSAVELGAYGIRVNSVSPYLVATPLAKKFFNLDDEGCFAVYSNLKCRNNGGLVPLDVAEAALYLASDESKYVSGHNLVIDGAVVHPGFSLFGKSLPN